MVMDLEALQERARKLVREALRACPPLPNDYKKRLTLGVRFEDNNRIFELYVDANRPEDAVVVARATLDKDTGTGHVETFPEQWTT